MKEEGRKREGSGRSTILLITFGIKLIYLSLEFHWGLQKVTLFAHLCFFISGYVFQAP
jgi:hypothetical protein